MALHYCPPPDLDEWLKEISSVVGNYGHLLLEQRRSKDTDLFAKLVPYFESAHLDARTVFHDFIGIDLHPDATPGPAKIAYPSSLHLTTLKGFFGEALTGLIVEAYQLIGNHDWKVPIFLFRFHDDAKKYLYTLARDPEQERQTIGRLGTDFIGFSVDESGYVNRLISGEAKWRKTLTQSVVDDVMLGPKVKGKESRQEGKGVWAELNKEVNPPSGLRELQIVLKEIDPEGHADTIVSMDKLLAAYGTHSVPKIDLVVIVGKGGATRKKEATFIDSKNVPVAYTAGNDLQVVEVILSNGEELVQELYSKLWNGED